MNYTLALLDGILSPFTQCRVLPVIDPHCGIGSCRPTVNPSAVYAVPFLSSLGDASLDLLQFRGTRETGNYRDSLSVSQCDTLFQCNSHSTRLFEYSIVYRNTTFQCLLSSFFAN